jgi:exosortase/archaeosortase family protein
MENKKARLFGTLLLLASFAVASLFSFWITNPSILDTDPSTYIIVVMLMLLLFIVFSYKERLEFKYSKRNILWALLVFLLYVVILSVLRVSLSYAFISYRLDGLIFPVLIASFILLIYGFEGIRKLWPILVYAAFASPLILMPILSLNGAFANLNAALVYWFVKLAGVSASKAGLTISSAAGSSITISTTCVSIGTFIAFILFLIPLAYLYDGKAANKLYWVLIGVLLILVLNLFRMLLVTFIWAYYGIGSAVNTFHLFAGQLIFYAAIVAMILITGRFGLWLGRRTKTKKTDRKKREQKLDRNWHLIAILCIIMVSATLFLSYDYLNAVYAPPLLFSGNRISPATHQQIFLDLAGSAGNVVSLGITPNGDLFSIRNASDLNNSIFIIANATAKALPGRVNVAYNPEEETHSYLLRNGITITAQMAESGNNTLVVNYFSVPYNVSGSWVSVNYLVFKKFNGDSSCKTSAPGSASGYFESYLYNFIFPGNLSNGGIICESYSIALGGNK